MISTSYEVEVFGKEKKVNKFTYGLVATAVGILYVGYIAAATAFVTMVGIKTAQYMGVL